VDSDGKQEQCTWCGEGGEIFNCDECPRSFCRVCLRKHFGRTYLNQVEDEDKFICLVCSPKDQLKEMQVMSNIFGFNIRYLPKNYLFYLTKNALRVLFILSQVPLLLAGTQRSSGANNRKLESKEERHGHHEKQCQKNRR